MLRRPQVQILPLLPPKNQRTKMTTELKALEGLGMDELEVGQTLPLIKILQSGAAEVNKTHAAYGTKGIPEAEAGDLLFMGDTAVLPQPVEIVPLSQKTLYAEWRPKSDGGGLVGHHNLTVVSQDGYTKGDKDNPNREYLGKNQLVLTIYFLVVFKRGEEWEKAILPFTSSNLKHGRALAKQIRSFKYDEGVEISVLKGPAIFSRSFALTTELKHGTENSWFEFNLKPEKVFLEEDKDTLLGFGEAYMDAKISLPEVSQQPKLEAVETDAF